MPEPADDQPKRFDIPTTGRTKLEIYRAMRAFFERKAKEEGQELHPHWYEDSPELRPELYDDPGKAGG